EGKIFLNSMLNGPSIKRARRLGHARMGDLIKQVPEPEGIEAAGDYNIIILIMFYLAIVFAFNAHGCVIGVNASHGAKHRAYVLGITELCHRFEREDATIGASHKFAPVALAQL